MWYIVETEPARSGGLDASGGSQVCEPGDEAEVGGGSETRGGAAAVSTLEAGATHFERRKHFFLGYPVVYVTSSSVSEAI